ncbi:hypothetical protein ACP70R_034468 [Stipagrostis hirtigluma subsp. patula]
MTAVQVGEMTTRDCLISAVEQPLKDKKDIGVQEHDDIWDDTSDDPGHESTLTREWIHRQNQFHKMGYRDGITEGQKDSAQEGFNIGFRQSVQDGHRLGRVRGITSVLACLPDSLKEKMVPDIQCRGELQDLHSSVQEISADGALQLFQNYVVENSRPGEEQQMTSEVNKPVDSVRIGSILKDLALLLRGCPDIKVDMASFEMTR